LRSSLVTSPLARLYGGWAPVEAEAAGMDFAERLGLWLNAFDAIRLQQGQQAIRAAAAPTRAARTTSSLAEDLHKARSVLARAIEKDPLAGAEPDAGYAPWRERHLELQRQMELLLAPLREHAREVLGRASLRLRQLAALDTVLQDVLAARSQALLPTLPALLERRYAQLRQANELDRFPDDWRAALLAELELRLGPVAGLVEALTNESEPRP
jgi:hypothetical protein